MPSTYTLNNGIELVATGEQSGTWGDTTNTNFELLDTSLDGQVTVTLGATGSSGSPNTLPVSDGAASNGRNRLVIFADSSDLGGTAYVQLTPNDAEKIIYVRNNLSGSRSILLFQGTYNASNDYEVPAGTTAVVFFNGAGSGAVAANVFNNAHFDSMNVVGGVTITTDDNSDTLSLVSTDADASVGPVLNLFRNSSSPADSDALGEIVFRGKNDAAGTLTYSQIESFALDVSNGTEDGQLEMFTALAGTARVSRLMFNSTETVFNNDSKDLDFRVESDGNANMLFVDAGNDAVIIGHNDGISIAGEQNELQVYDTNFSVASFATFRNGSDGATLNLAHSRSGTIGTQTILNDADIMGAINFVGSDGTDMASTGAAIRAHVDGTPGGNDMPGRLVFLTTLDGAAIPTERMRISQNGKVNIGTSVDTSFDAKVAITRNDHGSLGDFAGTLLLKDDTTTTSQSGGSIVFGGQDGTSVRGFAKILGGKANSTSGNYEGSVMIKTRTNGDSDLTDRVRIKGTEMVINEVSANYDFRVESDGNTHTLFVDAGNDNVGIGTSGPDSSYKLHVAGSSLFQADSLSVIIDATNNGSGSATATLFVKNFPARASNMGLADTSGREFGFRKVYAGGNTLDYAFMYVDDGSTARNIARMEDDASQFQFNPDSHDMNFSIESNGNSNMFYIDGADDCVSIGSNTTTNDTHMRIAGSSSRYSLKMVNSYGGGTALYADNNNNQSWIFSRFNTNGNQVGFIQVGTSSTSYSTTGSDRRLKKNFETWEDSELSKFETLKPQKFNYNTEDDGTEKTKGFIAQDLVEAFPEAYPLDASTDRYFFNPSGMVVYLMKAMQESNEKIKALEARITALENA